MLISTIILVGLGLYLLFYSISLFYKQIENKSNLENEKALAIKTYSEIRPQIKIPENCMKVVCTMSEMKSDALKGLKHEELIKYLRERDIKILTGLNYIWKKDETINLFPTNDCIDSNYSVLTKFPLKFKQTSIKIHDIVSFERNGEIYHENKISGGGGGGSSIGNAIIGGVIAGGAGAIVASRKKIEPITSELITHDERVCSFRYIQDNIKYTAGFSYNSYDIFKELIPEKDISIIDKIKRRNIIDKQKTPQTDNIQKIRDLGTLRDEGILTQEEFEAKKKELLKKV